MNDTMNTQAQAQTEEKNALALTAPVSDLITALTITDPDEAAPLLRYSTTSDTVKLFNAVNSVSESVKDNMDTDITVTDIVITKADVPSDINDEDSDRVSKPVIHFYTADGKHISSLSNGIVRATRNLLSCGLYPTPEMPVTIKFRTVNTKKGTAHSFDVVKF